MSDYERLTKVEREFADAIVDNAMRLSLHMGITLRGLGPAERAVEAIATWIMESHEPSHWNEKR